MIIEVVCVFCEYTLSACVCGCMWEEERQVRQEWKIILTLKEHFEKDCGTGPAIKVENKPKSKKQTNKWQQLQQQLHQQQ